MPRNLLRHRLCYRLRQPHVTQRCAEDRRCRPTARGSLLTSTVSGAAIPGSGPTVTCSFGAAPDVVHRVLGSCCTRRAGGYKRCLRRPDVLVGIEGLPAKHLLSVERIGIASDCPTGGSAAPDPAFGRGPRHRSDDPRLHIRPRHGRSVVHPAAGRACGLPVKVWGNGRIVPEMQRRVAAAPLHVPTTARTVGKVSPIDVGEAARNSSPPWDGISLQAAGSLLAIVLAQMARVCAGRWGRQVAGGRRRHSYRSEMSRRTKPPRNRAMRPASSASVRPCRAIPDAPPMPQALVAFQRPRRLACNWLILLVPTRRVELRTY